MGHNVNVFESILIVVVFFGKTTIKKNKIQCSCFCFKTPGG